MGGKILPWQEGLQQKYEKQVHVAEGRDAVNEN